MKKVASSFTAIKGCRSTNQIASTPLTFSHLAFSKVEGMYEIDGK